MQQATIEHWIGALTPVFPPESSFSFELGEGNLTIDVRTYVPEAPFREEGQHLRLVIPTPLVEAYERTDNVAKGAADGRLVEYVRELTPRRQAPAPPGLDPEPETWALTPEDLSLSVDQ